MKQQEGGDLVNTLINLSIPFGLVLAREYVPEVSKALKRLTKKGGSRGRKRRTARRNKKRKTIRGGKARKSRKGPTPLSNCQVGGMDKSFPTLTTWMVKRLQRAGLTEYIDTFIKAGYESMDSLITAREQGVLSKIIQGKDLANLNHVLDKYVTEFGQAPVIRSKGGKRTKRTKRRKQRGGFMRATTRNFCQMKKL